MNATTVAVDLAKNVFELAVADGDGRVIERHRLTRTQFERWFDNRKVDRVVMEACGSAHHWGRVFRARGIEVRLLPAQYVRAYVKRNKTDAADAQALLEAARSADIKPVAVKSVEQQALQALHRTRSAWMSTRTRRINTLRGFCREFGLVVPEGAVTGLAQMARFLADEHSGLPAMLRGSMRLVLEEIRLMEARIGELERELATLAKTSPACQVLISVPGIGLLTSTAMVAAVADPRTFDSARRYSSFLGLTPREYSSGNSRYRGRISKRGDRYIRMLLTHGARSVLRAATVAQRSGKRLDRLRTWALAVQERTNHNKATCALANKLARIAWAVWVKHEKFQSTQAHPTMAAEVAPKPAPSISPPRFATRHTASIMATKVGPARTKADNSADRIPIAASVWLSVCRFHVGTSAQTLTSDAGYTTATDSRVDLLTSVSPLRRGRSPYTGLGDEP